MKDYQGILSKNKLKLLNKMDKKQLQALLKQLKNLDSLQKEMWKKWIALFKSKLNKTNIYKVEYPDFLDPKTITEYVLAILKKKFRLNLNSSDLHLTINNSISSWLRIFIDNDMIDLSLNKQVNKLN